MTILFSEDAAFLKIYHSPFLSIMNIESPTCKLPEIYMHDYGRSSYYIDQLLRIMYDEKVNLYVLLWRKVPSGT